MPKIIQDFIPKSQTNQRPGHSMKPRYLTVHNTANSSKGANAEMHSRYLHNGAGGRVVVWHYTVDDKEIYQHIPTNENGWHAGDGERGAGNRQSIGIEICENSDGDFNKAIKNAQWLIKKLMKEHNIPIERVVPHKYWSGKNCPHLLLNMWSTFIDGIEGKTVEAPDQQVGSETVTNWTKVTGDWKGQTLRNGQYGKPVKQLQTMLSKNDPPFYPEKGAKNNGIDDYYGDKTEDAVERYQSYYGLKRDGLAGKEVYGSLKENEPKSKSKPSQAKGTVHLPASAKTWRTYKLNVKPIKKNSDWSLTPARYGGLTYKILDKPYPDVVTIKTGRGKRNIYVGSGTSAVIK
ncbi:N-acetylmuramoyl-L-alanine amidase [Virgibacillus sp. M23]|nr:N-acetylmuramoyl-L-alanine amidase [Virgibacillus sp. M23]MDY7044027.1 N-acetylmuramoyl-L-alanine amidase [Virgibacillus sp. M23]